jgi:hypothetical protein
MKPQLIDTERRGFGKEARKERPSKDWMAFMRNYYIASVRGLSFLLTAKYSYPKLGRLNCLYD